MEGDSGGGGGGYRPCESCVISQGHIVNSLKTEKCIKKIREINNEIGKNP